MTPISLRVSAALLAAVALTGMGRAQSVQSARKLLPSEGDATRPSQNLSTRWAGLSEIETSGIGPGFRAAFTQNEAYVSSDFQNEIDINGYDGYFFVIKNSGTTASRSTVELNSYLNGVEVGIAGIALDMKPGETKRGVIWFDYDVAPKQMQVYPPQLEVGAQQFGLAGTWNFNKSRVKGWRMWNIGGAATIEMQDLRLVKKRRDLSGIIDAYGQNSDLSWTGKVNTQADLNTATTQETNNLGSLPDAPTAPGAAQFGTTKATGKWRFERAPSGNWFAVNPQGGRSWIVGANHVMMDGKMILDGKEDMYASLPPREGNFGQFYSTAPYFPTGQWQRTFDMYRANLYRKYGQGYEATWRQKMTQRMKKWGINAASGTLDQGMVQSGMPYINHMQMHYFPVKLPVWKPYWSMPNDPFSGDFAPWCLSQFKQNYAYEIANNPSNLIGLAVGNEETWGFLTSDHLHYQIPIGVINASPAQPCKAPLVNALKTKYGTIARLNTAWNKSFASWDALMAGNALGTCTPDVTPAMVADMKVMLTTFADKYYSTIRAQLLKAGYKGAFLGSRDALDQTPDEVLAVQSKYVDAHTINNYESDGATWARIAKLTKPVILTEFNFSAVDRGHNCNNKNFEVGTQADRAVRVREYLDRAAATKNVAGVFFYGYAECPFTGRWSDDERFNAGLVDITDTPYKEVTDAFRAFGFALSSKRRVN